MRYIMNLNKLFRKKSTVEKMVDAAHDAGKVANKATKSAADAIGTCVIGAAYGLGTIILAAGEVAAEGARRREEDRQKAREARRKADEAEVRAQAAERKAYGASYGSDPYAYEIRRTRCTSCNGYIYEVIRRYEGLCRYSVTVRKYANGRIVRIEDAFSLSAAIDVEKGFLDEIRRGHLD